MPDLYVVRVSPNCRGLLMALKAAKIENVTLVETSFEDLMAKKHKEDEKFMKVNSKGEFPALDDDGFYLAESRAIMTYLVEKYGKCESLYPKDAKKRAIINRFFYFDMGTLLKAVGGYIAPLMKKTEPEDEKKEKLKEVLTHFDEVLGKSGGCYMTGSDVTLADFCCFSSASALWLAAYDLAGFPNVCKWMAAMKALDYYAETNDALEGMLAASQHSS